LPDFTINKFVYGYGSLSQNPHVKIRARGEAIHLSSPDPLNPVEIVTSEKIVKPVRGICSFGVGMCLPHPTLNTHDSLATSFIGRTQSFKPIVCPKELKKCKKFVIRKILPRVRSLKESELMTMEDYFKCISPEKAAEYSEAWEQFKSSSPKKQEKLLNKINVHKIFIKSEVYEKVTDPRAIYNPSSLAKAIYGWLFKHVEKIVFDINIFPEFIKKVPIADRPDYIKEILGQAQMYLETDFTSFESSITREWMENVEFLIYKKVFAQCSDPLRIGIDRLLGLLSGMVPILAATFRAISNATRMSGEMNTSLGNGLTNLIVMSYVFHKSKIPFKGVFEGDDALISCSQLPNMGLFEKLGFKVTFEFARTIGELSFCGMKFHEKTMQTIREFKKSIINMSLITPQYMNGSLNTVRKLCILKALSYLFENPNCPMVSPYAQAMLHNYKFNPFTLRSLVNRMKIDIWLKERYMNAINSIASIGMESFLKMICSIQYETRVQFAETFNVPIETQLLFELNPLSEDSKQIFLKLSDQPLLYNSMRFISNTKTPIIVREEIRYGFVRKTEDLLHLETVPEGTKRKVTKVKVKKINHLIQHIIRNVVATV